MGVGVESDGDAGVSQELLNELRVDVLREQERGAGVAQVVEGDLREAGPREQRREGSLTEVRRVDEVPSLAREEETLITLDTAGHELLLCLPRLMALKGFGCSGRQFAETVVSEFLLIGKCCLHRMTSN